MHDYNHQQILFMMFIWFQGLWMHVKNHNMQHAQWNESAFKWIECENRYIKRQRMKLLHLEFVDRKKKKHTHNQQKWYQKTYFSFYLSVLIFFSLNIKLKSIDWSIRYDPLKNADVLKSVRLASYSVRVATVWSQCINSLVHQT